MGLGWKTKGEIEKQASEKINNKKVIAPSFHEKKKRKKKRGGAIVSTAAIVWDNLTKFWT